MGVTPFECHPLEGFTDKITCVKQHMQINDTTVGANKSTNALCIRYRFYIVTEQFVNCELNIQTVQRPHKHSNFGVGMTVDREPQMSAPVRCHNGSHCCLPIMKCLEKTKALHSVAHSWKPWRRKGGSGCSCLPDLLSTSLQNGGVAIL